MTFDQLCEDIRTEFPSFTLVDKGSSFFMKLLNVFLLVVTAGQQKWFMKNFITTIGYTVYVPDGWLTSSPEWDRIVVLRHERIHMRQRKRWGAPLFTLLYLLLPLPIGVSYCRARFEWEAYTETLRAVYEFRGQRVLNDMSFKASIVKHFTSAEYVWMWPFKKTVEKWYDDAVEEILKT